MQDLLEKYSITEILIFLVLFALAIKSVIDFLDWSVARMRKIFNKEQNTKDERKELEEKLNSNDEKIKQIKSDQDRIEHTIQSLSDSIDMLIESDRDDIKSYITSEHHYFCYNMKWIDDYSLECLENRYDIYKKEDGNSFVKNLMDEVRALPKQPLDEEPKE
jgi:uncharacterized protein YfcZ (UPF0381/DUF406 family)